MKRSEYRSALNSRMSAAGITGFWSDEAKNSWIDDALIRVGNFRLREEPNFHWKSLEKAYLTGTLKDVYYYDYPPDFKDNSIFKVKVNGKKYKQVSEEKFDEIVDAGLQDEVFTTHQRFYLINPMPTENATSNMEVWGVLKVKRLAGDDEEPLIPPELDEAVIKLALATALTKERRKQEARAEEEEALIILNQEIDRQRGNEPMGYIGQATTSR